MKIIRLDPQTREPTADTWTLSSDARQLLIGRADPADIRIDSPDVSPSHAELSWQGGSLSILDLASINGIYLRDSRILRSALQDQDIFTIGGIPFRVAIEPADLAARRTRLLTFGGILLGAVLLGVLILGVVLDARHTPPVAPPEEPTPLLPPVTDPAFQQMSDQYEKASELLTESRRIIADGLDDLHAARLLEQALSLNTNLSQAALLLKSLQETRGPGIQRQIDLLISGGRYQDALDELNRQQALVGAPDAIQKAQTKIAQRIQYQNAIDAIDQGDLDSAESLLDGLSADVIPELPAALDRLAKSRDAHDWAVRLEDLADGNDPAAVQKLADDEPLHAPYLSEDDRSEVRAALDRVRALAGIQALIEAGNTYALMRYVDEVPQMPAMLRPLRRTLKPQADAFRETAETESAKAGANAVPVSLADALASYNAAKALSALYIIRASDSGRRQFRHHAERWNAYLAAIAIRARTYLDQGARGEARAILQPLLPHLDEFDPATQPLRALSVQLTPVTYSPGTSGLLDHPPAPAASE